MGNLKVPAFRRLPKIEYTYFFYQQDTWCYNTVTLFICPSVTLPIIFAIRQTTQCNLTLLVSSLYGQDVYEPAQVIYQAFGEVHFDREHPEKKTVPNNKKMIFNETTLYNC
jgi:hypothetical protein